MMLISGIIISSIITLSVQFNQDFQVISQNPINGPTNGIINEPINGIINEPINGVINEGNKDTKLQELLYKRKKQKIRVNDVPKLEIPRIETPKVETPKVETPKVETPKIELQKIRSPSIEVPKVETLGLVPPRIIIPKTEIPKPEIPKPEIPKPEIPKTEIPKTETLTPQVSNVSNIEELEPQPNITLVAAPKEKDFIVEVVKPTGGGRGLDDESYIVEVIKPVGEEVSGSGGKGINGINSGLQGVGQQERPKSTGSPIPGISIEELDKICTIRASERSIINEPDIEVWLNRLSRTLSSISRNIVGVGGESSVPSSVPSSVSSSVPSSVMRETSKIRKPGQMVMNDSPSTGSSDGQLSLPVNQSDMTQSIDETTTVSTSTTTTEPSIKPSIKPSIEPSIELVSQNLNTTNSSLSQEVGSNQEPKKTTSNVAKLGQALAEAARQFGAIVRGFVSPSSTEKEVGNDDEGMERESDYEEDDGDEDGEDYEYEYEYVEEDEKEKTKKEEKKEETEREEEKKEEEKEGKKLDGSNQ